VYNYFGFTRCNLKAGKLRKRSCCKCITYYNDIHFSNILNEMRGGEAEKHKYNVDGKPRRDVLHDLVATEYWRTNNNSFVCKRL